MHAHLFSPYALFVHRTSLDLMGAVAQAVFEIARNRKYAEHVLRWAPSIALHDPGSSGGVLGLDFHLTVAGPRLIEINTNPGGLLLNTLLVDAVQSCAPTAWAPWTSGARARDASVAAWLDDARTQLGRMPTRVAIVDIAPRNNSCIRSSSSMPRHSRIGASTALFAHPTPSCSGRMDWKTRMDGSTPSTTD
ncbi:hypothetical protein [Thermomonas carbonis]|uniref:hypothetical protein n=1 Tax=Thermomonas carbonis TaxID=1463158 RepID=UPI001F166068|nr:hypothetical protein [Thermomonas carbonis]